MGQENSSVVVGVDIASNFPLALTDELVTIMRYNSKYLTLEKVRIVHLLDKF